MKKRLLTNNLLKKRKFLIISIIALILIILYFTTDNFFQYKNLRAFLLTYTVSLPVVAGMTILLIGRHLDLSVGGIMVVAGAISNLLFKAGINGYLVIIISLFACVFCGFVNGFVITKLKVNSFITTLATMGIYQSIGFLAFTKLRVVSAPPEISKIAEFKFLGMEAFIWFIIVLVIIIGILLMKSKFFKHIYFMGGNPENAALFGIDIKNLTLIIFILMGLLTGLAGIVIVIRLRMGSPSVGQTMALDAIVASIIGGTSLSGGKGDILGSALGLILIQLIRSSLIFWGFAPEWHRMVIGSVLIIAVALEAFTRGKEKYKISGFY